MSDAAPVLVTFALPAESRAFTAALAGAVRSRTAPGSVSGALAGRLVTVVHTGVGDSSSGRQRLQAALEDGRPRLVVSAGYAGGLQPDLRVGDLLLGVNFSASDVLAAARALLTGEPLHVGTLLTHAAVAEGAADKAVLGAATGALGVDMETAWIAGLCAGAGVPLLSLRVISDAAAQSFPVPGRLLFDAVRQRPRYLALPLWLLAHPARVAPFVAFVRGLAPARARLTRALCRLVPAL